ncbi:uncharacterized protein BJ171DRAFT_182982 [Polychytrium aggregatum]|uniref:uncharacterized protein n=1 Tax=Polychytrium aggregatum TaxID=110093 RepID=UPI0022FE24BE|nr:uncharacterized protein BJ171DRAFT_182982 [Polychytrium aggregatum]KAI9202310.1 hypothetical protein BJ171DRAFT_182982 [Polychytrium aggregatum]
MSGYDPSSIVPPPRKAVPLSSSPGPGHPSNATGSPNPYGAAYSPQSGYNQPREAYQPAWDGGSGYYSPSQQATQLPHHQHQHQQLPYPTQGGALPFPQPVSAAPPAARSYPYYDASGRPIQHNDLPFPYAGAPPSNAARSPFPTPVSIPGSPNYPPAAAPYVSNELVESPVISPNSSLAGQFALLNTESRASTGLGIPTMPTRSISMLQHGQSLVGRMATNGSDTTTTSEEPGTPLIDGPTRANTQINSAMTQGQLHFSQSRYYSAIQSWYGAADAAHHEGDKIAESRAMANISSAFRQLGYLEKSRTALDAAFTLAGRFVKSQRSDDPSNIWIMAIDKYNLSRGNPYDDDTPVTRHASTASSTSTRSAVSADVGPWLVVMFLELINNRANLEYVSGRFDESIRLHNECLSVARALLEEYPLPAGLHVPLTLASIAKEQRHGKYLRLSYFHRSLMLALARAFSHLGACYLSMGMEKISLGYQEQAAAVTRFMASLKPPLEIQGKRHSPILAADAERLDIQNAVISANTANTHFLLGDNTKAVGHNETALHLFRKVKSSLGEARQKANFAAISLQIGEQINLIHWVSCYETTKRRGVSGRSPEFEKFHGPVRVAEVNASRLGENVPVYESGPMGAGSGYVDSGLFSLFEAADTLKVAQDWLGLVNVWIMIASGYMIQGQPYYALYFLVRVIQKMDTKQRRGEPVPSIYEADHPSFPNFARLQLSSVLFQILFQINRIAASKDGVTLFPSYAKSEVNNLPVYDTAALKEMLMAMGLNTPPESFKSSDLFLVFLNQHTELVYKYVHERSRIYGLFSNNVPYYKLQPPLDLLRKAHISALNTLSKLHWHLVLPLAQSFDMVALNSNVEQAQNLLARGLREMDMILSCRQTFGKAVIGQMTFDIIKNYPIDRQREILGYCGAKFVALVVDLSSFVTMSLERGIDLEVPFGYPRDSIFMDRNVFNLDHFELMLLDNAKQLASTNLGICNRCIEDMCTIANRHSYEATQWIAGELETQGEDSSGIKLIGIDALELLRDRSRLNSGECECVKKAKEQAAQVAASKV